MSTKRRMISPLVTTTDVFLDMPTSAQNYYFHLNLAADDDGFVSNPQTIRRNVRASVDDFSILAAKQFIMTFESGVIVIKHWRVHNLIRKDRYTETVYTNEKDLLKVDDNKIYQKDIMEHDLFTEKIEENNATIKQLPTPKITKKQSDKEIKDQKNKVFGEFKNVQLTEEQVLKLREKNTKYTEYIEKLSIYKESSGKKYKSDYAAILNFMRRDGIDDKKEESIKYVPRRNR